MWLEDAFIVKYSVAEAGGQPGLGFHRDDSELSFNLLLSDPNTDFTGGGTAFVLDGPGQPAAHGGGGDEELNQGESDAHASSSGTTPEATLVAPARGEMLSHFGRLSHAGNPVVSGTRYILAGFVRAQPLAELWRVLRYPDEPSWVVDAAPATVADARDSQGAGD